MSIYTNCWEISVGKQDDMKANDGDSTQQVMNVFSVPSVTLTHSNHVTLGCCFSLLRPADNTQVTSLWRTAWPHDEILCFANILMINYKDSALFSWKLFLLFLSPSHYTVTVYKNETDGTHLLPTVHMGHFMYKIHSE